MSVEQDLFSVKRLQSGDEALFSELVRIFNHEFKNSDRSFINLENLSRLLDKPGFVCLVATEQSKVIGGLTGHELESYDRPGSVLYLYDIAISEKYQRNGIGTILMAELQQWCTERDIVEIYVQADQEDGHALQFYRKLGGVASAVIHFSFSL